jgi:hypothetical protein
MTTSSPALKPVGEKWSGLLLTAIFLAIAVLLFVGIYLAFTANSHYFALIIIGVLALVLGGVSFLAEAFSREPSAQRSLAWGFFGMGFAVLFLSLGLGPTYGVISTLDSIIGLVLVLVLLFVAVAFVRWRGRSTRATENQQIPRRAWRSEPAPSAFSYAAANSPSVPSTAPPPSNAPSSPPPRSP